MVVGERDRAAQAVHERIQLRPVTSNPLQAFVDAGPMDVFADLASGEGAFAQGSRSSAFACSSLLGPHF